jgi:arylsulfatase A-like enzyme
MTWIQKSIAAAAILTALTLILFLALRSGPQKPCIVMISIDTLRADHLGCYGYPGRTSPEIDAFSRECVQFMRTFSQAPSTAASHMSIFTGLLPPVHRITNTVRSDLSDLRTLGPGITTLAAMLKKRGYLTIGLHGGSNVSAAFGFDRGFDFYSDKAIDWSAIHADPGSLDSIRTWIKKSRKEKKPFFLFLHHYLCHDPYLNAPETWTARFLKNPCPELPSRWTDLNRKADPGKSARELFWKNVDGQNADHRAHIMALYDAGVYYSDFIFGKIRDILKQEGRYDSAWIILLSDHGEEFWEHGDTLHWRLFRESLHVPLLLKFPGAAHAGMRIAAPVRLFDIMPTLLECLKIETDTALQAVSLMPLIHETSGYAPRIVSFSDRFDFVRFLDGNFTYSNQPSQQVSEWLFDRRHDEFERHNLASGVPYMLPRFRAASREIFQGQQAMRRGSKFSRGSLMVMNDELRKQLESLGYLR